MAKTFLVLAGILGVLAVIIGAFGAHALKDILSNKELGVFETGVRYHFFHTLALFGIAIYSRQSRNTFIRYAGWMFIIGILLFSGSIYLLACKSILGLDEYIVILGPLTPLGGLFFILGWLSITLAGMKTKK